MSTIRHISVFLFAVSSILFSSCKKQHQDLQGAVVTGFSGQVTITHAGTQVALSTEKLNTRDGFFLPGDVLKTSANSTADLQFSQGLLVRVGQNSQIRLSGARVLSGDNFAEILIDLSQGRVFTRTDRLSTGSSVAVHTPASVAMVRGTEFLVVQEGADSRTLVQNGSVQVTDEHLEHPEVVENGSKAEVTGGGDVTVRPMTDQDRQEVSEMGRDMQSISETGRAQIQSILENFEENKARIQQAMEEQKRRNEDVIQQQRERDKNLIQDQKEKDRQMIEDQIRRDREMMDNIRSSTDAQREDIKNKTQEQSDTIRSGGQGEMDRIRQNTPGTGQDAAREQMDRIRQNRPQQPQMPQQPPR